MDIIETTLLNKRVRLLQPSEGFHASMDTVFLAAAIAAKPGDNLLDMGCGVGSAGLCVMARVGDCALTGIDIQPEMIRLAQENARLNAVDQRTRFICADIRNDTTVPERAFNIVIINPPYLEEGKHTPSPNASRAIANGGDVPLEAWVRYAFARLIKGGDLVMIHRADRLTDILSALACEDFGAISVYPLWPKKNAAAKRVIVRARKHKKAPFVLHRGMVLHDDDGAHTGDADSVLTGVAALTDLGFPA